MAEQDQSTPAGSPAARPARWRALGRRLRVRPAALLMRECSITEASAVIMVSFVVSAVLGIVRQSLFNAHFGAGMEANAYYAAFRLPDTLATLIAGGALANAFIPVLLGVERAEGEQAAHALTNLVITTLLACMALCVALALVLTPLFVTRLLAPGFDAPTTQLTITLTRFLLLELLLVVVTGVATAVLTSRNQVVLPAIGVAIHNLALIGGILAAMAYPRLGIYGPTLGALGDAVLKFAVLVPGLRRRGFRFWPRWHPRDRHLGEVARLLVPNGLSAGVNYTGTIINTSFASLTYQAAALPALQNAGLLIELPVRLLGLTIGQAAFPKLATQAVRESWADMRRTLLQALGVALALAALTTVAMLGLGRPVIHLLFERGRFNASAAALTYRLLVASALALPAYIGTEVLTRGLVALRDTRTPLLTNCLQMACRIALLVPLIGPLGIVAVPIASAVSATLETLVLSVVLAAKLRHRLRAVLL